MISDIYLDDDRQLKVAMVIEVERKMERLKNKNILITGGTRGIGLASAQEFERERARVVICGTDEKTLKEARSTLGPKALAFSADVSKLSDLDALYSKIKAEFGHLVCRLLLEKKKETSERKSAPKKKQESIHPLSPASPSIH